MALVFAAVAAVGYSAFSFSREEGIEAAQEEASNRLALHMATLFAPTDKYSYLPELVSNHPTIIDGLLHKNEAQHIRQTNLLLEHLNDGAGTDAIYVLDTTGLTIAASNWNKKQSFVGKNYAFRPYFQDAMQGKSSRFYGMGTTSMMPGYYMSHAVGQDGRLLGVVAVKIDISNVDRDWRDRRNEVMVTDGNGVIFLSSQADWKYRPLRPLMAEEQLQLRNTHQYDKVLKAPLPLTVAQRLPDGEQIVFIRPEPGIRVKETRYFMKASMLPGSDWTVHVLVPLREVDTRATWAALVSATALALLILSFLYVRQMRHRHRERERSRRALEQAHETLEQQHRELQKLSDELRITSITDPLTGAYNRRFFFESAAKIVSTAQRHGYPFSVVTIDVDHFKNINDSHGHPAGDRVLQALTAICKESLREADLFARFGGEEFIMLLPNTGEEEARAVAERVRAKVAAQPVDVKDSKLDITISCGVSQYRTGETDVEPALKRADVALYAAKNSGRNQVVVR